MCKDDFMALVFLSENIAEPWEACLSSPCDNAATCIDVNVDTFICMCRDGFFGLMCENSKLPVTCPQLSVW